MNQDLIKKIWIVFGSVFLFIASPYCLEMFGIEAIVHIPGNVMGFPIPGSPIFLFFGFLIPILFFVLLKYWKKINYIHFFTGLVSIIALLDAYWVVSSLSGGVKYLGETAAKQVVFGNIICFLFIYFFIGLCYKWRNFCLLYSTAMLLCLTLTFVAFPWLGEYI